MKLLLVNSLLTVSALGLAVANWRAYCPEPLKSEMPAADIRSPVDPGEQSAAKPEPAATAPANTEPAAPSQEQPAEQSIRSGSSSGVASFAWAQVETSDYKEYAQRLRAIGFPEELVRSIIVADVDKLYEAREKPLEPPPIPYDTPPSQQMRSNLSPEDWQRIEDLWKVRIEKQGVLEEILGSYVPREILQTPNSMRNYESYEYAISLMPEEKRNATQLIVETEILKESMNKDSIHDRAAEFEAFRNVRAERDDALHQLLSPEEFEIYEMNTAPVGTELARQTIGMEPTEQEFISMYRIAARNWVDTGGVYGRWRATPLPPETIAAANREMNESLEAALGPDRFLDYLMSISESGQRMRNFAARFGLPRETLARAFELQSAMDSLARAPRASYDTSRFPMVPARGGDPGQLRAQLEELLGPQLWQAWQEGKNLRVKLDP